MKLALIGFGELGRYIKEMVGDFHEIDESKTIYFDDDLYATGAAGARPFKDYLNSSFDDHDFYVCLGYKHLKLKKEILASLIGLGRRAPHFIHPTAYLHPSVKIGAGSFIYPGCSIDRNSVLGMGTWIANADVIPHNCTIGDCCWFGASVTLSGKVTVGDNTFIGSGVTVANDIQIGSHAIIGMGTAVTKNIPDYQSVIGNPMRVLAKPLRLF